MIGARLPLALETGGLTAPTGRIAVFHPTPEKNLRSLPMEQCEIIQPFRPAYDAFKSAGYNCAVEPKERYAMSIICLPRAKAEARSIIAKAAACTDGLIIIDGQKTEGVDSIFKDLRKRGDVSATISKAHGKLFWINSHDGLKDWALSPTLTEGGFGLAQVSFLPMALTQRQNCWCKRCLKNWARMLRTLVPVGAICLPTLYRAVLMKSIWSKQGIWRWSVPNAMSQMSVLNTIGLTRQNGLLRLALIPLL